MPFCNTYRQSAFPILTLRGPFDEPNASNVEAVRHVQSQRHTIYLTPARLQNGDGKGVQWAWFSPRLLERGVRGVRQTDFAPFDLLVAIHPSGFASNFGGFDTLAIHT